MHAFNAAIDVDHLRAGPSIAAYVILDREGEANLASNWMWADRAYWGAMATRDFLVAQRTYESDGSVWGAVTPALKRNDTLETLIEAAQGKVDEATRLFLCVNENVERIAQGILDRTPGAATADIGAI